MSDMDRILVKLDDLSDDVHEVSKQGALNKLALANLNGELQEHKRFDAKVAQKMCARKNSKSVRNVAIAAVMCAAISCWIAYKGLVGPTQLDSQPVAISKGINNHDQNNKGKQK